MGFFLFLMLSVFIIHCDTTEICSGFEGTCPPGWHYYVGSDNEIRCFKVFIDKFMTFHEAEGVCSQIFSCFHSQLASFHSKVEYDFIVRLQAEAIPVRSKRHSWIGMQHSGRPKPEVPDKTAKNRFELRFEDHSTMFNFTYMDDHDYGHYWGFNGSGSSTHGWEPNGDRITQHSDVERCVEIGTYVISQTNSTYGVMNDNDCEKKFYNVAPPYQIWPPLPQPAEYMPLESIAHPPRYAIAPPILPPPRYQYMVDPMNNWYNNRYTFPNANGQNDFYRKALLAAFDDDLDPIDLFSN